MKCLAVNTATKALSIAIVEDEKVLHFYGTAEMRDQGNLLMQHIKEGMEKCGLEFSDLDLLAVVTGPGSFTGIRLGLAAMRGIALAAEKPLIGVSSFDMFFVPETEVLNIIAVESWREELYFAVFDGEGHPMLECMNETPEVFVQRFRHDLPGAHNLILSGDAAAMVTQHFPEAVLADSKAADAVNVARTAMLRFKKSSVFPSPTPYYLREADITISTKNPQKKLAEEK